MSSSLKSHISPVVLGSIGGNENNMINGISGREDGHFIPKTCGMLSQSTNTNQCSNPRKPNMSYATGNAEDRQAVPIAGTPVANGPGSLLSIGLSSSLSVISPLTKDSASGQASGLRHRINQGSLIEKHLLRAEEHRKISKGFNISSRNAVKRWFVLYDDSHKPIGGGGESKAQIPSNIPPPATYHDIVIDTVSGSPASTTIDPPYYIPAHLEYHDNEKKWRAGGNPNKDIILKDCFNICRKLDGAGIKDHVIAVVSIKDTLDIIFEKEQDMLIWLELLLSCQQGGRSAQGRIAKPIYENMWEVNVKGFKSDKGSSSKFFQMTGPHRLVATEDAFKFFELGSDEPIPFAYKDIKGHKNHNRNYIIQTGRMTRSGRGEIEIDCKDHHVSAQIYATFERFTKETIPDKQGKTSSGHHGHFHGRMNSTSSSRSSRSRDSMQGHGNVLNHGSSAVAAPRGEYRPRSESWSNPTIPHSLTDSKHGVLPGYPGKPESSNQGSGVEEKPSAPNATTYSDIAAGKQSILANMVPKKDPRFRTTSEGNHFGKIFPIKSSGGAKYSITSGSPMSPGSYMSSESNAESAGSSNSIDDTEIPYGPSMTPNADHAQEATIFEESSAESWVDPSDPKSIEEHIMKEEEIKDAKNKTILAQPNHHNSMNRQIGTSSLIGRVGQDISPFHYSMANQTSNVGLGKFTGESSSDMKRASSLHANISTDTAKRIDEVVDSDASTISYAQLSLEKYNDAPGQEGVKAIATNDFLPGSHPALIGVPIPRCQNSFKRGVMGGEHSNMFGLASSPSQTHYATIMNANDMSSTNIPTAPMYLVTSTSKATDLTIATSPLGRGGGSSDYMLMSPPPSLATPPVPNSVNYALSVTPNSNNNANNNNLSSVATNCSGSSSSTSSLKRQQSLGNGSNCGARSNISTLERERRRLSMLGLDEDRITSMLMTSSLTGSVSNPRDPSSSLITSPSSQSSYNPLSDGGCLDKEDLTAGGDEEASVYTLMSPTGGVSTTSQVPIPGASSPNSTSTTARQISHSFNPSKTHSISSLNRRYSGRRSVGNNYKDVVPSESAVSNQTSNIDFKPSDDSESSNYVHMCPPSATASATSFVPPNVRSCDTEKDNLPPGNMSACQGSEHNRSGRLTEDQVPNMAHPPRTIEESSSSNTGSRRGSKSSLSHLGSSPSAALTSHLAGPVLPLYTDLGNSSTTNFDQSNDVSPYLLMSPVSTDEKLLLRDECDNPTNQTLSTSALKGSSNIPMHPVVRTRHRNRMSNSGSKRSSMCSDGGTGNIPISSPNLVGSAEANKNVETAEWLSNTFSGSSVGCKSGGSRNSSLVGTPIGSLPTSSSLHHYKDAVDGVNAETYLSKQRSSHKDNILPEYSDDVYVPLNFGDDDGTVGSHDMPLQDHEITLSQRRSTSTASGNIQIPARQGQARNALPRMSPASSGSLISGATPSSFKGMDAFPSQASGFSETNMEETSNKEDKKDRSQNCDGPRSSIAHGRAFSMSSTNRPSTVSSSNSSIGSSMGQGSKQSSAKVQGQPTKDKTNAVNATQAGTSPNTMAARLGSWFRTRAGSVPARPSMDGKRRHRTQSEGEKNFEPSISLPENEQT